MTKIIFIEPDGKEIIVEAQNGLSLLEVAHNNGVSLEGACEGSLACSTCHLIVEKDFFDKLPEPSEEEKDAAYEKQAEERVTETMAKFDKNSDDTLDADELTAAGPVGGFLKRADKNNDGKVTKKEMIAGTVEMLKAAAAGGGPPSGGRPGGQPAKGGR